MTRIGLTSGEITRIEAAGFERSALVMNHNGSGVGFFNADRPGILGGLNSNTPVVTLGNSIEAGKPVMALSRDLQHIAIALPDRIEIIGLPGFVPEYTIPTAGARGLEFRESNSN